MCQATDINDFLVENKFGSRHTASVHALHTMQPSELPTNEQQRDDFLVEQRQ